MARPTDWVDTLISFSVANAGQTNTSLITGLSPADMRGATLIRTLVKFGFASQTVAGAWGVQEINLAIGVASQEAFAAGVLPDPNVPTDKPPRGWVYRSAQMVSQNGVGTQIDRSMQADIRGARKIENGELFLIATSTAISGTTFTTDIIGLVRTLIKLA